jgi:biopolymer transport protein ExbB
MLDNKRMTPIIALIGAMTLMFSAPAIAQTASAPAESAAPAASSAAGDATAEPPTTINQGKEKLTPITMFLNATPVVKTVIVGLALASLFSWTLLLTKLFEFGGLNRQSDRFLEAFRGARSIADINRIATSDEFEGNPMADMAAAAATEVELSRQAGLQVAGEHRDSTIMRASSAVQAVQASLSKRLSSGMQFLA